MEIIPRISTPRQSAARAFYLAYLNSPEWRTKRNRALKHAEFRCHKCGSKRDLNVHHLTYDRLGCEWDGDLEVLCFGCHQGHHLEESEGQRIGVYVKLAREALKTEAYSSIADIVDAAKTLCATHKVPYDTDLIARAVRLVIGARLTAKENGQQVLYRSVVEGSGPISNAEAHELFCRLGLPMLLKSMPDAERTPAEQRAHEEKIRQQAIDLRNVPAPREKRRPIRERLENIFTDAKGEP